MRNELLIADLEMACVLARRIEEENGKRIRRILERLTAALADEQEDQHGPVARVRGRDPGWSARRKRPELGTARILTRRVRR